MRTSFVESMGPWASDPEEPDVHTEPGAKTTRETPVNVPTPQPAPKK